MIKERKTVVDNGKSHDLLPNSSVVNLDLLIFAQHMLIKPDVDKAILPNTTDNELRSDGGPNAQGDLTNQGHDDSRYSGGTSERSTSSALMHGFSAAETGDAEHAAARHHLEAAVSTQTLLSAPAILNEVLSSISGLPALWELTASAPITLPHSVDVAGLVPSQVYWLGSEGHQVPSSVSLGVKDEVSVHSDHTLVTSLAGGRSDNNFWTAGGSSSTSYSASLGATNVSILDKQSFGSSAEAFSSTNLTSAIDSIYSGATTSPVFSALSNVTLTTTQATSNSELSDLFYVLSSGNGAASPESDADRSIVSTPLYLHELSGTQASASNMSPENVAIIATEGAPVSSLSSPSYSIAHAPDSFGSAAGGVLAAAATPASATAPVSAANSSASSTNIAPIDGSSTSASSTDDPVDLAVPSGITGTTPAAEPILIGAGLDTPTAVELAVTSGELVLATGLAQSQNILAQPTLSSILSLLEHTTAASLGLSAGSGTGTANTITSVTSLGDSVLNLALQQVQDATLALLKLASGSSSIVAGSSDIAASPGTPNGNAAFTNCNPNAADHPAPGILPVDAGLASTAAAATQAAQNSPASLSNGILIAADHPAAGILPVDAGLASTASAATHAAQNFHASMSNGVSNAAEHSAAVILPIGAGLASATAAALLAAQNPPASMSAGILNAADQTTTGRALIDEAHLRAAREISASQNASAGPTAGITNAVDHAAPAVASTTNLILGTANAHTLLLSEPGVANEVHASAGMLLRLDWNHDFSTTQPTEQSGASLDRFNLSHAQSIVSYENVSVVAYGPAGSATPPGLRALLLQHLITTALEVNHPYDPASIHQFINPVDSTDQHMNEHRHEVGFTQPEPHHSLDVPQSHLGQLDLHSTTFHIDHLH